LFLNTDTGNIIFANYQFKDSTSADQRIEIHFDITLHKLACALVTIDLMSQSGDNQDAIEDDVFRQRLDSEGNVIEGAKPEKQG
jgi:hypothetical protein